MPFVNYLVFHWFYIINRILHDRLEIRNFPSRVQKYFTSERSGVNFNEGIDGETGDYRRRQNAEVCLLLLNSREKLNALIVGHNYQDFSYEEELDASGMCVLAGQ